MLHGLTLHSGFLGRGDLPCGFLRSLRPSGSDSLLLLFRCLLAFQQLIFPFAFLCFGLFPGFFLFFALLRLLLLFLGSSRLLVGLPGGHFLLGGGTPLQDLILFFLGGFFTFQDLIFFFPQGLFRFFPLFPLLGSLLTLHTLAEQLIKRKVSCCSGLTSLKHLVIIKPSEMADIAKVTKNMKQICIVGHGIHTGQKTCSQDAQYGKDIDFPRQAGGQHQHGHDHSDAAHQHICQGDTLEQLNLYFCFTRDQSHIELSPPCFKIPPSMPFTSN